MSPASVATALAVVACCIVTSGLAGAAAGDTDTVSARRPLRGNETVVSAQGKFELGLFSPGGAGRFFYLGIWYKNVPVQTVIWVANRVSPLSCAASAELRVSSSSGNLELVGLSASSGPSTSPPGVVWSSNSNSNLSSKSNVVAVMRDNGNLVLLDGGNVLWQSFDHPTDTLVPEAWLGEDKLTGEYQTLTSWRNAEDPGPGMFTNTVDPNNGNSSEFFYLWNGSRAYWRSGVWTTGHVFANVPEAVNNVLFNQTYVDTPAYRRVTSVLYDNATITRLVMDVTGQTKQFVWVSESKSWQFFWAAPTVQCDVYALCGAFGVCDQRSQPPCKCPPGFAPTTERDWGLSDWSAGCHRSMPLQCNGSTTTDGFLELPGMKLPDDPIPVAAGGRAECELACLTNCSCQAYTFSGGCAVWHHGFRNLQQLLFPLDAAGGGGSSSSSSLYLRLSESELQQQRLPLRNGKKKRRRLWLIVLPALGVSAAAAWILVSRRRKRRAEMAKQHKSSSSPLAVYSYGDLRSATSNFSERLGGGSFGSVYRGVLSGRHGHVAVKKMEGLGQGDKQFRTEVNTLGLIHHVNLVRLLGFCSSSSGTGDKLLVYEYMPNGSLDSYLFGTGCCPSWRRRYGVMIGVARGLAYLHDGCRERIIHCDIKPENILLDGDFTPKIADFGMAKLVGRDFSRALTTMRGTVGYLAPEWISGMPISAKVDVYSFGMLLFELISGSRNAVRDGGGGDREPSMMAFFFPVWAAVRVAEGDTAAVADPRLQGDVSQDELERACRVACWCIQDHEAHRPAMAQVVQALEGVVDVDMPPVPRALQHLATLT